MGRSFKDAVLNRRTYYSLSNKSFINDDEIEEILRFTIKNIPSAFNSQSTRLILLLNDHHKKLWEITKSTLQKIINKENFPKTEKKIDNSFLAGYGTVLFFEDKKVIEELQKNLPVYKEKFADWYQHTSAMHQFVVWTMLEDAGFGASLQHYNPLIDEEVKKTWNIDPDWELIAQMPFGVPLEGPGEKEFEPVEKRLFIHK